MDFTIGLDAELRFRNRTTGAIVYANRLVRGLRSKFGVDGCSSTGEIRPTQTKCPIEMTKSIRTLFQRKLSATRRLVDVRWVAGGYQEGALGAHIHI